MTESISEESKQMVRSTVQLRDQFIVKVVNQRPEITVSLKVVNLTTKKADES